MRDWTLTARQACIAGSVLLTAVTFLPAAADPINTVKLVILTVSGLAVVFLVSWAVLQDRVLRLPTRMTSLLVLGLALALLVATLAAPNPTTALVGAYGRNTGLLAYVSVLVLFTAGARGWSPDSARVLILTAAAAGLFTASYGLLQYAGIDAIAWRNEFNPIIAALGNPDFASGYLGICVPAAAWGSLQRRWGAPRRIACVGLASVFLVTAVLSRAVQGPAAATVGIGVLAVGWLLEQRGSLHRRGLAALAGAATLAGLVVVAGLAGVGPAARIFARGSFTARRWYWEGALTMVRHSPWSGVGLDQFGSFWRRDQPLASARQFTYTDAAHSVPLQMLSQGGVVLGLAYAAFSVATAVVLVRGLRRLEGDARLTMAGVGAIWSAYVAQSVVSIDHIAALTIGFAAAGAVWALGSRQTFEVRLPGALTPLPASGRQTRLTPGRRSLTTTDRIALGALGAVTVAAAWYASLPLRANMALHHGEIALANGDGNGGLAGYASAARALPGVGYYSEQLGILEQRAGRPADAIAAYRTGLRHDPLNVVLLRDLAALEPSGPALRLLHQAVVLDPYTPSTLVQAAAVDLGAGDARAASRYLTRGVAAQPTSVELWLALGKTRRQLGDSAGARSAFLHALQLSPKNAVAIQQLKSIGD